MLVVKLAVIRPIGRNLGVWAKWRRCHRISCYVDMYNIHLRHSLDVSFCACLPCLSSSWRQATLSFCTLNCQASSFRQMSLSHSLFVSLSPCSCYIVPLSLSLWLIVQHFPFMPSTLFLTSLSWWAKASAGIHRCRRAVSVWTFVLSPTQPDYYPVLIMCSLLGCVILHANAWH